MRSSSSGVFFASDWSQDRWLEARAHSTASRSPAKYSGLVSSAALSILGSPLIAQPSLGTVCRPGASASRSRHARDPRQAGQSTAAPVPSAA
jgi:hypothetical protein